MNLFKNIKNSALLWNMQMTVLFLIMIVSYLTAKYILKVIWINEFKQQK